MTTFADDYIAAVNALSELKLAFQKIGMAGHRSLTDLQSALLDHGAVTFKDIMRDAQGRKES